MAVNIVGPSQQTSMGRRLLSMAAPIAGGAIGGPAGAALGGIIGGKLSGESGRDSILSGAKSAISYKAPAAEAEAESSTPLTEAEVQTATDSPFERRANTLSQDPQATIAGGLDVLAKLDPNHPLRKELGPSLIRAKQMMGA